MIWPINSYFLDGGREVTGIVGKDGQDMGTASWSHSALPEVWVPGEYIFPQPGMCDPQPGMCASRSVSPTLLLCCCPSFLWERMFNIQVIPSSILDVSFHRSISHQWSLAVNFHTSAVFLGNSSCFANWTESGKGSLPCTHRKGPYLSSLCQPAGRLAEALAGPEGKCPPSVFFSLPLFLWGKCISTDLMYNLWINLEAEYMKRVGKIESPVNNEEEEQVWEWPHWSSFLQELSSGGCCVLHLYSLKGLEASAQANSVVILYVKAHQNWQTLSDAKENGQEVQL